MRLQIRQARGDERGQRRRRRTHAVGRGQSTVVDRGRAEEGADEQADAQQLAWVTGLAVALSCMVAGFLGAVMPLLLRKLGFNPAMAANLVMSGLSDIVSLSLFLLMAVKFAV